MLCKNDRHARSNVDDNKIEQYCAVDIVHSCQLFCSVLFHLTQAQQVVNFSEQCEKHITASDLVLQQAHSSRRYFHRNIRHKMGAPTLFQENQRRHINNSKWPIFKGKLTSPLELF